MWVIETYDRNIAAAENNTSLWRIHNIDSRSTAILFGRYAIAVQAAAPPTARLPISGPSNEELLHVGDRLTKLVVRDQELPRAEIRQVSIKKAVCSSPMPIIC